VSGTLYGTTQYGGSSSDGTVFDITTAGKESISHTFKGYPKDGSLPLAGLTDVSGTLYGTSSSGGTGGEGAVFTITSTSESLLYSFVKGGQGRPGTAIELG
jgi:uncharacterized repeat protein (TIGR03803 family)